jgi:hypothetical protein
MTGNILLGNDVKVRFGSEPNLEIYSTGSASYIKDIGTGSLYLSGGGSVYIESPAGETMAKFQGNGSVDLYYDNSKKFETTSLGATISGKLIVNGDLDVSGTTTTFNSSVVTVDDPVFTVGGDTAPTSSDNKDRGIEFRYFRSGESAKVGFFGYDNSENAFTILTDATNNSEVFSGTLADLKASKTLLEDGSASAPSVSFSSNNNTGIYRASGDNLAFSTGGTEAARFDSDGNFTTVENIKIPDGKFLFLGGSTDLQVYHNGFHSAIDNYTSDLYIRNRVNGGKDIIFLTKNSSDVLTELLRLDGSASSINVPDNIIFKVGTGALSVFHNDNNETWNYFSSSSGPAIFSHAANDQDFVFQTTTGGTTSEVLRLDGSASSINVPDDVRVKVGSSGDLTLYSNNANTHYDHYNLDAVFRHFGTDKDFIWYTTTGGTISEVLRLDGSTGNVGIGGTPSAKLDVAAVSGSAVQIKNTGTAASLLLGIDSSTNSIYSRGVTSSTGRDFRIIQGATEAMRITSSGNVGIGTTSPATKLVIDNGGIGTVDSGYSLAILGDGIDGVQIISSSSNQGRIVFGDDSNGSIGRLNYDHSNDSMSFVTNGSEAMRIDSSGKVGIGTTSPVEKITCRGNIGIYGATSGGAVTETPSLHFYTSEASAGFNTATSYNIGEISWSGKDSSLNCTGKYASIETKLIDANTQIQGTENEGGQLDFNIYRHDVATDPRVKHIGLRIDNYANIYQNFINYTDDSNYEALKISAESDHIKYDTTSIGSFASNVRDHRFYVNGTQRFYVTNSGAWTTGNFYINGSGALRQASIQTCQHRSG